MHFDYMFINIVDWTYTCVVTFMYVLASNRIGALMDADAISRLDYG